jgi:hypothetical protein
VVIDIGSETIDMGKPKTTNSIATRSKNGKSNPFAVKKSIKKAKKKIKPTLELVDKTFGDLQGQRKILTSAKKLKDKSLTVAQEIADTNKPEKSTPNVTNVDQLVNDTAQARIY